jgi:type I restriction enzyme M protein
LAHAEFKSFAITSIELFNQWKAQAKLSELKVGDHPKDIIQKISEKLLSQYSEAKLLDKYDIYQLLMDYWQETMQDDTYVVTQDDWLAGQTIRPLTVKKGEKLKETPDLIVGKTKYKAELIPPALIVARYFSEEQNNINALQADQDVLTQQFESFVEENTAEDGLLVEALTDSGKVSKASIAARLKLATKTPKVDREEISALEKVKKLIEQEATAKKAVKAAQETLDQQVLDKYPTLDINDIKTIVVEDKWLATLHANITAEIERVTHQLANRVKTLEERYAEPLPKLTESVNELENRMEVHLKAMGLSWSNDTAEA